MRFVVLKGAALLGGVNALHTAFPEDAIEEYKVQGKTNVFWDHSIY